MKLYNSKKNKIEEFKPLVEGKVSMYVCGPTVYNHAHIGNARPIVVFDVLRRVLTELGLDVHYVSNFTDVDDRIIKIAQDEGVVETEVSNRFIDAYNSIRHDLDADHLDATPKVTDNIEPIIDFIAALIESGYAYESNGDVFFRVRKVDTYGEISSQNVDALRVGSRIEENTDKEDALDFVLWKHTSDTGIKWDSPWGQGRPGWHTECVVMIQDEFKTNLIDIHGGGMDLRFPHHENESAQAKALHHHDLANYWVHNAMLNLEGQKMSKSLGNVVWAKDYIETLGANATRWLLLSTHYRLVLNITDSIIEDVTKELLRIETVLKQAYVAVGIANLDLDDYSLQETLYSNFMSAMSDDLNVENAKVFLFETIKELNQALRSKEKDDASIASYVLTLERMNHILGLSFDRLILDGDDRALFVQWNEAKANKDFISADVHREALLKRGLI